MPSSARVLRCEGVSSANVAGSVSTAATVDYTAGGAVLAFSDLMGDDICSYWFFGRKVMPYRSPARHYYLARNSILLQKRRHVPLAWKFSNLLKLCFTYLYFGWYHPDRAMQRRQIGLGIRDGLKGITGKSVRNPQGQPT